MIVFCSLGVAMSVLTIVTSIFTMIMNKYGCSVLFTCSWMLMSLFSFLGFLVGGVLITGGTVSVEICEVIYNSLNDREYFVENSESLQISEDLVD